MPYTVVATWDVLEKKTQKHEHLCPWGVLDGRHAMGQVENARWFKFLCWVLTSNISECDLIGRQGLYRDNRVKVR